MEVSIVPPLELNSKKPSLIQLIFYDGTPKKALITALIVGSLLTMINHGDLILKGELPLLWKILLTYCTPYCVTTWGAATGKFSQWKKTDYQLK